MYAEASPGLMASVNDTRQRGRRSVSFSDITIHVFRVGWNPCAVTCDQVPGVGLQGIPIQKLTSNVPPVDYSGKLMKYTTEDRLYFLKRQGLSVQNVVTLCMEQNAIQVSRRITALEWIQGPQSRFAKYLEKRKDRINGDLPLAKRQCVGT